MNLPEPAFRLASSQDGGVFRVELVGELDMHSVNEFTAVVEDVMIMDPLPEGLDIDASGLEFVDSSGLRAFLQARTRAVALGVPLRITERSERLERLLELTGLGTMF